MAILQGQKIIVWRDIQWCIKIHLALIQTISIIKKFVVRKEKKLMNEKEYFICIWWR